MSDLSKQRTFSICRRKNPGVHAKWNCWDQFWPGVASKLAEPKRHLVIGAWKTSISCPIFIVKTTFAPQQTRNELLNETRLLLRDAMSNSI